MIPLVRAGDPDREAIGLGTASSLPIRQTRESSAVAAEGRGVDHVTSGISIPVARVEISSW